MSNKEMPLTRSHLLRRMLQRRVELLEKEKVELKVQVLQLEERLNRAPALPGPTGAQVDVSATMESVRAISGRAQVEAVRTMREVSGAQSRLAEEMTDLLLESQQLRHVVLEASEGINTIIDRTQSSSAELLREAHRLEEELGHRFESLYTDATNENRSVEEVQALAAHIQKRAERVAEVMEREARRERTGLRRELENLDGQTRQLRDTMRVALQRAQAISEWTQGEAERMIEGDLSPIAGIG